MTTEIGSNSLRNAAKNRVEINPEDLRDFARSYLEDRIHPAGEFSLSVVAIRRLKFVVLTFTFILLLILTIGYIERLRRQEKAMTPRVSQKIAMPARIRTSEPSVVTKDSLEQPEMLPIAALPTPFPAVNTTRAIAIAPVRTPVLRQQSAHGHVEKASRHRRVAPYNPASRWIADPLYGEAFKKALVEDRKLTAQANEAQLTDRAKK